MSQTREWLDRYLRAWVSKDPADVRAIFTDDAKYWFVVNACVFGLFAGAIVVSAGGAVGWAITVGVLVGLGLIAGLFWYSGAGFRGAWRRYVPRRQTPPGPPPYWRS